VLRTRFIDFEQIYGADFSNQQRNLFRYFAKSFGCRLVDAGAAIPSDLIAILLLDQFRTALRLTLAVDERIRPALGSHTNSFIGKGPLMEFRNLRVSRRRQYTWNEHLGWLRIHYWYDAWPHGSTGATWVADAKYIYLGAVSGEPDASERGGAASVAPSV